MPAVAHSRAKTRARACALTETGTVIDRSRILAWNAFTVLVFVLLTTYVARAEGMAMSLVAG